jgi:hypothetical protein
MVSLRRVFPEIGVGQPFKSRSLYHHTVIISSYVVPRFTTTSRSLSFANYRRIYTRPCQAFIVHTDPRFLTPVSRSTFHVARFAFVFRAGDPRLAFPFRSVAFTYVRLLSFVALGIHFGVFMYFHFWCSGLIALVGERAPIRFGGGWWREESEIGGGGLDLVHLSLS